MRKSEIGERKKQIFVITLLTWKAVDLAFITIRVTQPLTD